MRTAQELFDIAVQGMLTQNERSRNAEDNMCRYRGTHGRKCPVGFLISDEDYRPEFEGPGIDLLLSQHILPKSLQQEFAANQKLLFMLQAIHDYRNPLTWAVGLQALGEEFHLSFNPPAPVQA